MVLRLSVPAADGFRTVAHDLATKVAEYVGCAPADTAKATAVIESLASGTPAIVSDRGGPADIVRNRETGLVVAADDAAAWRGAIVGLLDNPRTRRGFGVAGRAYAEQCTFERSRAALWDFYEQHIERVRRSLREDLR